MGSIPWDLSISDRIPNFYIV